LNFNLSLKIPVQFVSLAPMAAETRTIFLNFPKLKNKKMTETHSAKQQLQCSCGPVCTVTGTVY